MRAALGPRPTLILGMICSVGGCAPATSGPAVGTGGTGATAGAAGAGTGGAGAGGTTGAAGTAGAAGSNFSGGGSGGGAGAGGRRRWCGQRRRRVGGHGWGRHGGGGSAGTGGVGGGGGSAGAGGVSGRGGGSAGAGGVSGRGGGSAGASGSAGSGGAPSVCGGGTAAATDVTVNLGAFEQTMDGFGICNTYQSTAISDATADQFFDQNKGIGLSIFRLGIKPDGSSWGPIGDAKKAADRGAIVWAAPWTPPANCKSNNSTANGGHLNMSCYDSWANTLAAFPAKAKQGGVTVMGISVQNESDNATPYESTLYTNEEMVAFIKVLGPKLKALSPPVKLLGPESTRWEDLWGGSPNKGSYSYGTAILADSTAAGLVDILATHMYETQVAVAPPAGVTKPIWQTEMSGVMGYPEAGPSSDIGNGIVWANWIYDAIVVGRAGAWHAWWMTSLNDDNEGLLLLGSGSTKRFYTVGNYSKFIRPGYKRVTLSGTVPANVKVTAYTNTSDGTVVIVAINSGTSVVSLPLFLSGPAPCAMTPWVTSANDNLASKTAVSVSGSRLAPVLAAQSVTTFVGKP